MAKPGKNTIVLSLLFFGPLVFYLFLLTGTNNFAKLPEREQDSVRPGTTRRLGRRWSLAGGCT